MRIGCEDCGRMLPLEALYQRTSGWVRIREAGGGHAVAMPEREPRFLCGTCLDVRKLSAKGGAVNVSLFGDD